jgi:hypothetical protein
MILGIACLTLAFTSPPSGAATGPMVRGTAADTLLGLTIRSTWPAVTDIFLPAELPEGWRFSRSDDPLPHTDVPDVLYANPTFNYVPMTASEQICGYIVSYTNGREVIEVNAGYWPASGGSRFFLEQAASGIPTGTYFEGLPWTSFRYLDAGTADFHVLLVGLQDAVEGQISYVYLSFEAESSRPAAEAMARSLTRVARLSPFQDVSDMRDDIITLMREGIVQGYADGTFRPNQSVRRAQLAKMLVGALGLSVEDGLLPCPFRDVPAGPPSDPLYPDDFVAVAAANGIVNGYQDRTFKPFQPVTRVQMVSMLVRALERFRPARLVEPPAQWCSSDPAAAADPTHGRNVRLAESNGLLSFWASFELDLQQDATRSDVALLLWAALGGEMTPLWQAERSPIGLAEVAAQLRGQLGSGASIYLPGRLPEGWALARVPLPPDAKWELSENPGDIHVDKDYPSYKVAFTNGWSVITLWAVNSLGDPGEVTTADFPTTVRFNGNSVEMFYMEGKPAAYSFGTGQPAGWVLLGSKPWDREDVLAFAAAMQRTS